VSDVELAEVKHARWFAQIDAALRVERLVDHSEALGHSLTLLHNHEVSYRLSHLPAIDCMVDWHGKELKSHKIDGHSKKLTPRQNKAVV
jgi:hypothetical protein